jgi:hypothetical protein
MTSPLRATAGLVVSDGFVRECVQASGRYIVFDFTVPGCGVELGKPCSECVEFGRSEQLNSFLYVTHAAHDLQRTVGLTLGSVFSGNSLQAVHHKNGDRGPSPLKA